MQKFVVLSLAVLTLTGCAARTTSNNTRPKNSELSAAQVQGVVRAHQKDAQACYEQHLQVTKKPADFVRLKAQWKVNLKGRAFDVVLAEGEGVEDSLWKCLSAKIRKWQFPKRPTGEPALVTWGWTFKYNSK